MAACGCADGHIEQLLISDRLLVAVSYLSESLIVGFLNGSFERKQTFGQVVPKSGRKVAALPLEFAVKLESVEMAVIDPKQPHGGSLALSKVACGC